MLTCLLGGGGARADILSLLYLRPVGMICLAVLLLTPGPRNYAPYRPLFVLIGLFATTMLIQLVPLPPSLWLALPEHARLGEAAAAAGMAEPWRPLSLAPDLTLNSLLALLPCLVVLVGFARIEENQRRSLLSLLVGFVLLDAIWGLLQYVGGPESPTYLYRITNSDAPVGFFSNRNHNAVFMALGFPILALWARPSEVDASRVRVRFWLAIALGLFLIPMILSTGSRAGLALGAISLFLSYWISRPVIARIDPRWRRLLHLAGLLVPVVLIGLTIATDRAVSLHRLQSLDPAGEQRLAALPVLMNMLKSIGAVGVGYGAFDPAYRIYEPDAALQPFYFNHAHNDLIELTLTGGWIALLILASFLFWYAGKTLAVVKEGRKATASTGFRQLGAIIVAVLLGASLVDYPLRTPLAAAIFTIACAWLLTRTRSSQADKPAEAPASSEPAPVRWRSAVRIAITGPLLLALAWIGFGNTVALTLGEMKPDLVRDWWPFDAKVNAAAAAQYLDRATDAGARREAETLAETSLERTPVNPEAMRTLALLAALRGEQPRAERMMAYAETLSRRDLPTELWLIEDRVRANDIPGALVHYDRALRTSAQAGPLLFPILVSAAENPDILGPLARLIANRPSWWLDFTNKLVAESRSATAIEIIVGAERLDSRDVIEQGLEVTAIDRLIELGSAENAMRLYERSRPETNRRAEFVHNGDFEAENRYPPIDWTLADGVERAGIVQTAPQGQSGHVLQLVARNGSGGEVARQLVLLRPGRYRFSALAGDVGQALAEQPEVWLLCVRSSQPVLQLHLPASPATGRPVQQDFTVGASNCPAQWLSIRISAPLDEDAAAPWVDRIAIVPLAGQPPGD